MSSKIHSADDPRVQQYLGKKFNRLTASRFLGTRSKSGGGSGQFWEFKCDCGKLTSLFISDVKLGRFKSCGCGQHAGTHGYTRGADKNHHPLHSKWRKMWSRCTNPNVNKWSYYGGAGVTVCKRWEDFENFLADMGPTWKKGLTIDRWPNQKGNYEPSNCRWATWSEQAYNRSTARMVEFNGENLNIKKWGERLGIGFKTLINRLNRGWSVERAFTTPPRPIRLP